jgi:cation diffusion facilitator CzcD-associated flavoprotein CzcO
MAVRKELLEASDQEIEDAVPHGDPVVLRGVLYLLTGDESIAATEVVMSTNGIYTVNTVSNPVDVALLRAKAAEFLKSYRDQGAPDIPVSAHERLQRSVGLTAGEDIPNRDKAIWSEELALHPWARGLEWPTRPAPEKLQAFRVLVIGAGMMGLNAAAQLKHAGIPYTVVEKNADVGGTWWENRYPGSRVDTPSRAYTLICGAEYNHPYQFSPQSENLKYTRWLADRFDVRQNIEFETEVKSIIWDEGATLWEVRADGCNGPRSWRVNAVITAVGFLSRPNLPALKGAEAFTGELFHTARWPSGIDITGKRVAVIGSGCSGYQTFPEIARVAAHTFLFQRTPSWVFETKNYLIPLPSQVNWLERALPYYRNFLRFRGRWLHGPKVIGHLFDKDPEVNDPLREQRLEFMRRKFAGRPELFDKMLPSYPPNASRPVLVDEKYSVYGVLLQDNTTLVTDGIAQLTPHGIVDGKRQEHAVDVIVLATGFRANNFLWPMEIRGRERKSPEQLWGKDGARAYLGAMLPGFPNFFMIYGPNTNPTGGAGNPAIHEMAARFILQCLAHLILNDKRTVDVTVDAYCRYNDEVDKAEVTRIYAHAGVKNYYTNEHGRSAANCPFDARKMWEWLRDPTGRYAENAPGDSMNADSRVRPYFGQDLIIE